MKVKLIFFLILLINFNLISCGIIIPDPQNPILVYQPSYVNFGQMINLYFQLPQNSVGLGYKQFIAVKFPTSTQFFFDLGTDFGISQATSNKFKCNLINMVSNISIIVTPIVVNVSADKATFFCRLDDVTITSLSSGVTYLLQITLTSIRLINSMFARKIALFTASSIQPERVIYDYNPSFCDMAMYSDYTALQPAPYSIDTSSILINPSPLNLLTPFTITFNIIANQPYIASQSVMMIRWPNDIIKTGPNTIQSSTSLNLISSSISSNMAIITGIYNDVPVNKSISIRLGGFVSSDIVGSNKLFELIVMYKNTYSIISYSSINNLTTVPNVISNVSITSSDNFPNIYQGGAYNLNISFKIQNTLPYPGFIVIQHTDSIFNGKRINFLASTCDFTSLSVAGVTQSFGSRPICYPLRYDFNYPNSNTNNLPYPGSGFAFKIPSINSATYKFNIFAFVEYCVSANTPTSSVALYDFSLPSISSKFNIGVYLYKQVDMTQSHENRFSNIPNNLLASGSGQSLVNCVPAISNFYNGGLGFHDDDTYSKGTNGVFIYNQFNDFKFASITSNKSTGCSIGATKCFFADISAGNTSIFTEGSVSANSLQGSYIAILGFKSIMNNTNGLNKVCNIMACAAYKVSTLIPLTNYKIELITDSNFFVTGDPVANCYFSWGVFPTTKWATVINPLQVSLLNEKATGIADTVSSGARLKNIISGSSTNTFGINQNSLSSSPFTLTSVTFLTNPDALFPSETSVPGSTVIFPQLIFISLFTSCIKWANASTVMINTPFRYIDVQLNVKETPDSTNYYTTKVNRFFKFVTETYMLDSTKQTKATADNVVQFHHVNFPLNSNTAPLSNFSSLYANSICMIQINNAISSVALSSGTNTLIIFVTNLMMLDMDLNDITSTYPISANLPSYAMNSVPFFVGIYYQNVYTNYAYWTNDYADKANSKIDGFVSGSMKMRTINKLFLGSTIWIDFSISSLSAGLSGNDLLIPTYCPIISSSNQNYRPLVNFVFVNSSGFNTNSIDTVWNPPDSYANTCAALSCSYGYFTNLSSASQKVLPTNSITNNYYENPVYVTIRFNAYTNPNSNQLYILPGQATQKSGASGFTQSWICTGYSLFLNSFTTNGIVNFAIGTNSFNFLNKNLNTKFYIFGKPMNTALMFTTSGNSLILTSISQTNLITGIQRPAIDSYLVTNSNGYSFLSVTDKIAFFCSSKNFGASDLTYYTNYNTNLVSLSDPNFYTFILDWNNSATISSMDIARITQDKTETLYKNDAAGNIQLNLKMPNGVTLPGKYTSIINLASPQFSTITACGIQQKGLIIANSCSFSTFSTGTIDCPLQRTENDAFIICCYGVNINADIINFPTISVNFLVNPSPTSLVSSYVWRTVYLIDATKLPVYSTNNSNNINDMSTTLGISKITSVVYNYLFQELAYTKAIIIVSLPREPVIGSKIILSGDFSMLYISAYGTPRCFATFNINYSYNQGDGFIESCIVNIVNPTGLITISMANRILNCGMPTFGKTLYINIWPVVTTNWTLYTSNFYIVSMVLGSNLIVNGNAGFPITYSGSPLSKKVQLINQNSLCDINSVIPSIVNEYGDYQFNFNLSYLSVITSNIPNEFYIFFPFPLYNISTSTSVYSILCFFGNINPILVSCNTLEENWLRVLVYSGVSLNTNQILTITGIQNPSTSRAITFLCSVNYINLSTGNKIVLATGTGVFNALFNDPLTNNGYLLVKSISSSQNIPRLYSNYTFLVSFDNNMNPSNQPTSISNSPYLVISFPFSDFKIGWYINNKITAIVNNFDLINGLPTSTLQYNTNNVYFLSNTLVLYFGVTTINFTSSFTYLKIQVLSVPNPIQEVTTSIGRFKVTLSNVNVSSLYRNYSNLSNLSINQLASNFDSNTLNLIQYTRGLNYTFSNSKYILDLSCNYQINQIFLTNGIANKCYFYIRNPGNNVFLPAVKLNITLIDPYNIIKISNYPLVFYTTQNIVNFMIGVNCMSPPGTYFIYFSLDNTTYFLPIPPIQVNIDNSIQGIVSVTQMNSDVVIGGEQPFYFTLSDYTVDSMIFNFTSGTLNDSSAYISNVSIPMFSNSGKGYFNIYNPTAIDKQKFIAKIPLKCWGTQSITIFFNVSIKPFNISNINLNNTFSSFSNSDTDPTILRNIVFFTFSPPASPLYLKCVLLCASSSYPTDNDILNNNIVQSPLMKYFESYIISSSLTNINFEGLVRGKSYKLKCIASTTESNVYQRTTAIAVFEQMVNNKGKITRIDVPKKLNLVCNKYNFNSDPGEDSIAKIINYCQNFITSNLNSAYPLNINPACLYCIDTLNNTALGINPYPNSNCNPQSFGSRRLSGMLDSNNKLRELKFLQSSNSTSVINPVIWNLCVVQDYLCSNDNYLNTPTNKTVNDFLTQDFKSFIQNADYVNKLNLTTNVSILNNVTSITDFSLTVISNYLVNGDGSFILVINSLIDIFCFYKIAINGQNATISSVIGCNDPNLCGNFIVNANVSYSLDSKQTPFLAIPNNYTFINYCINELFPFADNNYVFNFSFSVLPIIPKPINITNNNTPDNPYSCLDPLCSLGYIRYISSFSWINLFIFLLF